MDPNKEQQIQEIEALESMYSNELRVLCRDFPHISVELEVRPDLEDFAALFGKNIIVLRATFPADYPNAPPEIELPEFEGGNEENSQQQENHFWRECAKNVRAELDKAIEESVGMPMLFTLLGTLQEFFVQAAENYIKNRDELERQKSEKIEREELAKFEGTRVTVESFRKWNKTFLETVRTTQERTKDNPTTKRLTGKQLFLTDKSLNISDLQFLDSAKGESPVEIDQSLFEDDIDFDEDDTENPEGDNDTESDESK